MKITWNIFIIINFLPQEACIRPHLLLFVEITWSEAMFWCTALKVQFQWDFPCFNCHRFYLAKIGYLSLTSCHKKTIYFSDVLSVDSLSQDIDLLHQTLKHENILITKKLLDDENLSETGDFFCGRSLIACDVTNRQTWGDI